jgi:hypothetical protein
MSTLTISHIIFDHSGNAILDKYFKLESATPEIE